MPEGGLTHFLKLLIQTREMKTQLGKIQWDLEHNICGEKGQSCQEKKISLEVDDTLD